MIFVSCFLFGGIAGAKTLRIKAELPKNVSIRELPANCEAWIFLGGRVPGIVSATNDQILMFQMPVRFMCSIFVDPNGNPLLGGDNSVYLIYDDATPGIPQDLKEKREGFLMYGRLLLEVKRRTIAWQGECVLRLETIWPHELPEFMVKPKRKPVYKGKAGKRKHAEGKTSVKRNLAKRKSVDTKTAGKPQSGASGIRIKVELVKDRLRKSKFNQRELLDGLQREASTGRPSGDRFDERTQLPGSTEKK